MSIGEKYGRFLTVNKNEKSGIAHGGRLFCGTLVVLAVFIIFLWVLVDDYLATLWDISRDISLYYWLFGTLFLFCAGLFGLLVFKNLVKILLWKFILL